MKPEDREQYVKYRIKSAYKTMDAAESVEPLFQPVLELIKVIEKELCMAH